MLEGIAKQAQIAMHEVYNNRNDPTIMLRMGKDLMDDYAMCLKEVGLSEAGKLIKTLDHFWGLWFEFCDDFANSQCELLEQRITYFSRNMFRELCIQLEAVWDAEAKQPYRKFGWGLNVDKYRMPEKFGECVKVDIGVKYVD